MRRRPALGRILCAVLVGTLGCGGWVAGCRCQPPPPAAHDAAPADAGQGAAPEFMAPAEARQRWVRLVGADQARFRTLLALDRDLRKRCADPTHRLGPDEVAPLGRFVADLAPAARTAKDRRVVAVLAAEVKRLDERRCDEALRETRSLFGGAR